MTVTETPISPNPHPFQWWVARQDEVSGKWHPELCSVGSKGYALGYAAALDSMYPHPPLRLVSNLGVVTREYHKRDAPKAATVEAYVQQERIAQLEAAAKSGLTELLYLAEQVKARKGGSVRGAILALEVALNRTITKAMGSFHKHLAKLEGIPASPAAGAGTQAAAGESAPAACPECCGKGWTQAGGPDFANLYQEKCGACDGSGTIAAASDGISTDPTTKEDVLAWLRLGLHEEKHRRTYYQTIVYEVCSIIDRARGDGKKTVCGTVDSPTAEVQETLRALLATMEPKF